jgi:hypothetical protein
MVLGCGQAEPPRKAAPPRQAVSAQSAPPEVPGIGRAVIDWQRGRNPPIRIVLGIGGVATGPEEGPLVPYLYPERGLAETAHYLSRTYARFRVHLASGRMVFHGTGRVRPGPAEQRMIVEWARRATASLAGGSTDSYGLALSWHRGASVGSCESVSVFLTGEVRAQACAWVGEPVTGRLQPSALERVYGWFDTLAAFQDSQSGMAGEAEASRLVFAGRGKREPTPEETGAIEGFAAAVLRELSVRRRGCAPAPPPVQAGPAGKPAVEPVLPRLLLPQEPPRSPGLPPLARLAPAVPPPVPPMPPGLPSPPESGGAGNTGGISGRRSAVSQPLRRK